MSIVNNPLSKYLNTIPAGEVILTDAYMGYHLPALTPHFVVAMKEDWASPDEKDVMNRIDDAEKVLSHLVSIYEKEEICRKYNVDLVIVDVSRGDTVSGQGYKLEYEASPYQVFRFNSTR